MKFTTCFRLAGEALAQLGILGGDAGRAGVEVTHAHHHAPHGHQRCGGKAKLLCPQQRAHHHVRPVFELTVVSMATRLRRSLRSSVWCVSPAPVPKGHPRA